MKRKAEDIALTNAQELADASGAPCNLTLMNTNSGETSKGTAFPQPTSRTIWGFSESKNPKAMNWEKVFSQNPHLIGKGS